MVDIRNYKMIDILPDDILAYYQEEHEKGRRFGMFAYIPHLLSLGEADISRAEVINWSDCAEVNE